MRYAAVVIFCAGYFNNISRTYFSVGHGRRRSQAPCTAFNAPDAPTPAPSPTWPVVRTQNIPQIQGTQNYHRLGRSTDALCGSEGSSFQRCKIQYLCWKIVHPFLIASGNNMILWWTVPKIPKNAHVFLSTLACIFVFQFQISWCTSRNEIRFQKRCIRCQPRTEGRVALLKIGPYFSSSPRCKRIY